MAFAENIQGWQGIYAMLQSLYSGVLVAPAEGKENISHPISSIVRNDESGRVVYQLSPDQVWVRHDETTATIDRGRIFEALPDLYKFLSDPDDDSVYDRFAGLLADLHITYPIPADGAKIDFTVHYFDTLRNIEREMPVSVKHSGARLLAANRAGNMKYDILNVKFSNPESNRINRIEGTTPDNGVRFRLIEIARLGAKLKFTAPEGKFFLDGLSLIDLHFPKLLAEITRLYYTTELVRIDELTEEIKLSNPYKIRDELIRQNGFYEYKIKQFLTAAAGGMRPTKIYRGYPALTAHLYIHKPGDCRFYDPYDRQAFEEYLFHTARFATADCDAHKFGYIEKKNGQWLFKLNVQLTY